MIVYSDRTVVTAAVLDWADDEPSRMAWLADCLARHLSRRLGRPRRRGPGRQRPRPPPGQGRVLSAYRAPRRPRRHHHRDARSG